MQQQCNACQQDIRPDSVFCIHCGHTLIEDKPFVLQHAPIISRLREELQKNHHQRLLKFGLKRDSKLFMGSPVQYQQIREVLPSQLDVRLDVLPVFNYALYHCGIGQVNGLRITNNSKQTIKGMHIAIKLVDFGETWEETIPSLTAGEYWKKNRISPPLYNDKLSAVTESTRTALKLKISDNKGVTLWSNTFETRVLAYNEWIYSIPDEDDPLVKATHHLSTLLHSIATFVQPNAKGLGEIIEKARGRLQTKINDRAFSGYQKTPDDVFLMLEALHETLAKDIQLDYINPPTSFEYQTGQKISLTEQTLAEGHGTCLDLAVLQTSLWERIGLHPQIIIIEGHAMMGCWLTERPVEIPKVVDLYDQSETAIKMINHLEKSDWIVVNSTEITQNKSFEDALINGIHHLQKSNLAQIIDIDACRNAKVLPLP